MPVLDNPKYTFEENWYGGVYDTTVTGEHEINTLNGHCFDVPYIPGIVDDKCSIFIDSYLSKLEGSHLQEIRVDIYVLCHRESARLSKEDQEFYNSIGISGNRVDCIIQAIYSTILGVDKKIQEKYSIGSMNPIPIAPIKPYLPSDQFYGRIMSYTYQTFHNKKR